MGQQEEGCGLIELWKHRPAHIEHTVLQTTEVWCMRIACESASKHASRKIDIEIDEDLLGPLSSVSVVLSLLAQAEELSLHASRSTMQEARRVRELHSYIAGAS